jgi:hypothetical protein
MDKETINIVASNLTIAYYQAYSATLGISPELREKVAEIKDEDVFQKYLYFSKEVAKKKTV